MNVASTLRVPLPRLGDRRRHTECACYFSCGLAALGQASPSVGGGIWSMSRDRYRGPSCSAGIRGVMLNRSGVGDGRLAVFGDRRGWFTVKAAALPQSLDESAAASSGFRREILDFASGLCVEGPQVVANSVMPQHYRVSFSPLFGFSFFIGEDGGFKRAN